MNPKRIVIIEGDAFDADAIVAIYKSEDEPNRFKVWIENEEGDDGDFGYEFADESACARARDIAIEAWRSVVGYLPVVEPLPLPLPDHPTPLPPRPEPEHWSDEKGRYFETYGGLPISIDGNTGLRFVWNEGPPRRKNPLGEGASPIGKVYIDQEGKPLDPQPIG